MKNWFYRILVQLRIRKPSRYVVYRNTGSTLPYWISLGSVLAASEKHALDLIAKAEGFKNFVEICRVSGFSPEAHRIEKLK